MKIGGLFGKKPLFEKVTIVGVGLMGGSLGLAIKKHGIAGHVTGVVHRKATIRQALSRKAVDSATLDLKSGVQDADLVILSGPIPVILKQLKLLKKIIDKQTLVIDVGSTKNEICRYGRRFLGNRFIGCHPMAGSEKKGVQFASASLFKDSMCFMTASHKKVRELWTRLGARTLTLKPKSHDIWVAQASHLPHVLAFTLFQGFPIQKQVVANPSIRDFARLSQSDAELWADILLSNRDCVLAALKSFRGKLAAWDGVLTQRKRNDLIRFIKDANKHSYDVYSES